MESKGKKKKKVGKESRTAKERFVIIEGKKKGSSRRENDKRDKTEENEKGKMKLEKKKNRGRKK